MHYHLEFFFQTNKGKPYKKKISEDDLACTIGQQLFSRILHKVYRRIENRTMPEVIAFFEHGGRQVVSSNLTSRGNVYIELVES